MYYEYTSEQPSNIQDVIRYGEAEHPYELIAYSIENQYNTSSVLFPRIR